MALQTAPFLGIATTVQITPGSTTSTLTFTTSTLGYPSARITNAGTAAMFIQFITTSNTTTVGVTNSQPVLATSSVVLATGGMTAMGYLCASTFTVTAYVTAGQGATAD